MKRQRNTTPLIKSIKHILFIVAFCLCQFISTAQESEGDSLLSVLKITKQDSTKIKTLHALFLQYEFGDKQKAKDFLDQSFVIAKKIDDKKNLAQSYLYLGYFSEDNNKYSEALKNYYEALKGFEAIRNDRGIAACHMTIGNVFAFQGNFPESLKNYFACLKIYEKIKYTYGIASCYDNIGSIYSKQENYSEALKNQEASLKIYKSIDSKLGMAYAYNNIGMNYYYLKNNSEALKNYLLSLKLKEELSDKTGIANSYNAIGAIYVELGDYTKALENYSASLKSMEEAGNKENICISKLNFGIIYRKQKKYAEARDFIIEAKKIARDIGAKIVLRDAYWELVNLDELSQNYKGAYENHKMYILYRDSLDNEETRKQTIQSQMTYDFEKKEAVALAEHKKELENQNVLAEEKSRKQKIVLSLVIGSLILVIIFAGFIFRSLNVTRNQKAIIETQKQEVEQQKQEVEQQKTIVEEHQKEIIDSITYARRIQQSLLPTEKYIEKNLNRLNKRS